MQSYSQLGEDIFVFQNFLNTIRGDNVLMEIGAYDGKTYSNTLALESYGKCRCVLVEPSPVNVKNIFANRPNASIHQLAVSLGLGMVEFIGHSPVGGSADCLSEDYIEAWKLAEADRYKVLTAPLSHIVEMNGLKYIDFMSIDVQGGELNVLSSMNWEVPVGTICIELEGQNQKRDQACRAILQSMGFEFCGVLHISEFWHNRSYDRNDVLFDANTRMDFDKFTLNHFSSDWVEKLRDKFY
jgi:FkbM family methyltransferase